MTYFKRLTVIMLVVAMILGTAGIAGAAPADVVGQPCEEAVDYLMDLGVVAGYPDGTFQPARTLTRAEVAKIIVLAHLGEQGETLAGYLKGAYSFSDVPADHWASGYIKLAQNLGVIAGYPDGTFKPLNMVTHIELVKMLAAAAGLAPGAGAWPTNWLTPGLAAGIVYAGLGVDEPVTRCQMAMMAHHTIANVVNPATGKTLAQSVFGESLVATLTLAPEASTVAIGAAVQFVATAKDAEGATLTEVAVTYTTNDPAKSAVNATGLFVASASGHYTVTAKAGSEEATAMVHVFGAKTALRATPETTTVPANDETEITLKVEVVDANGILVANDSKTEVTIGYGTEGNNGAVDLPSTLTKTVANGVTTFKVTATANADVTDIVKFSATDLTADTVEVTTVDQIATAIELKADPTELMANEIDDGWVTATVVDQAGEPMLSGVYELTFSIVGKGTFAGKTANKTVVTYLQEADVEVWSEKGDPGTFTVTVTGEGLTSASVTVNTYIAGSPVALKVIVNEDTAVAGEDDFEIVVGLVDKWGHWTVASTETILEFDYSEDAYFCTWLEGTIDPLHARTEAINFHGEKAGTWTITVTDKADKYPAATFAVTVLAGDPYEIVLSPAMTTYDVYVPITAPTMTFTAQVKDEYGNNVATEGLELVFWATGDEGNKGDYDATNDGEVKTDATGKATCTFTFDPYVDDAWYIEVETADDDWDGYDYAAYAVIVTDTIAGSITITTKNVEEANITTIAADEDEWVYVTVEVKDTNGNLMDSTLVEITFSNKGENVQSVTGLDTTTTDGVYRGSTCGGTLSFEFEGAKAGAFTITAKALQTNASVTRAKSFRTKVGTEIYDILIFKADGTLAKEVELDQDESIALKASPVDYGGNVMAAPEKIWVYVQAWKGEYRLTATGTMISYFEIEAGKTFKTLYFSAYEDCEVNLYNDVDNWGWGSIPE